MQLFSLAKIYINIVAILLDGEPFALTVPVLFIDFFQSTLVVVDVATIGTFVVPNYDMSISIRLLGFTLLFLTNYLGALGLIASWHFLFVYLLSFDSFGVPYFQIDKYSDYKDMFIRAGLCKIEKSRLT